MRYVPQSNWHHFFDGFQASAEEFLEAIEKAVKKREVPDLRRSRIDYQERGMFSAYREYLRAGRGRFVIDICAAPFGTGFFVSWWFAEGRPSPFFPTLAAGAIITFTVMQSYDWFGLFQGPLIAGLAVIFEWLAAGLFVSQAEREANVYFFAVLLFGPLWERYFAPPTYYRQDTQKMYEAAVHAAIMEVVDAQTGAKECRPLTEMERSPILYDFYRKRRM
ncbi:MAG: hypothetical protein ACR2IE_17965 [Candidatus Sumerlaeaceae bacterium]